MSHKQQQEDASFSWNSGNLRNTSPSELYQRSVLTPYWIHEFQNAFKIMNYEFAQIASAQPALLNECIRGYAIALDVEGHGRN